MDSLGTTLKWLLTTAWLLPLFGFVVQILFSLRLWGRLSKAGAYLAVFCIGTGFVCSATAFYLWGNGTGWGAFEHVAHGEAHDEHAVAPDAGHADHGHKAEDGHKHADAHKHAHADHKPAKQPVVFSGTFYSLAQFGKLNISLDYYIDSLTLAMFVMVTFIATCIHVFATGYMSEELVEDYVDHQVHGHDGGHFHRPGRFYRFFSYLSLFCFAMLGLVLAGNIFQVFIFWELVGICSYLLIGFYVERHSASTAANKAFIVNRVGDFGFIIGLMILWTSFGTFNFADKHTQSGYQPGLFSMARGHDGQLALTADGKDVVLKTEHIKDHEWQVPSETKTRDTISYTLLIVAGLGVFGGCVGKSAQFPLQTWLPDAMEGPTPVSALVHSATMVAAGVYLAGRFYPMFTPEVLLVIAYVGCITAFVAATIAIVATDIKKVLAYSTISQLGYMMLGLGVGGWGAGLLHLITHAFFKSLMFLCSGSVIYGCHHEQEMPKMGGLLRKMPITAWTMWVGVVAITGLGIPQSLMEGLGFEHTAIAFSGFYSKDEILATALAYADLNPIHFLLFLIPLLTAGITSFYMWRLWCFTFLGKPRDHHVHDHAHESPAVMTTPLVILAIFAAGCAWTFHCESTPATAATSQEAPAVQEYDFALHKLLAFNQPMGVDAHRDGAATHTVSLPGQTEVYKFHATAGHSALLVAFIGMVLAYLVYGRGILNPDDVKRQAASVHAFLANKWGFDDLYDVMFVKPAHVVAKFAAAVDKFVFDEVLHTLVRMGISVSKWDRKFDEGVIDGFVNLLGNSTHSMALSLRSLQTGKIRQYVTFIAISVVTLFVLLFALYPKG